MAAETVRRPDADGAGEIEVRLADLARGLLRRRLDQLRACHQPLARPGQLVTLRAALEEGRLKVIFQRRYAPGHGGMVNVQLPRSRGQLAGPGNRQKELEIVPVKPMHSSRARLVFAHKKLADSSIVVH